MSNIKRLDESFNELQMELDKVKTYNSMLEKDIKSLQTKLKLFKSINILLLTSSVVLLILMFLN
jgi:peptidoglycan hydrolase CwlO-like protein